MPQTEIAEELGISRIPVREALIGLEREGRVAIVMPAISAAIVDGDGACVGDEYVAMMRQVGEKVVSLFASSGLMVNVRSIE